MVGIVPSGLLAPRRLQQELAIGWVSSWNPNWVECRRCAGAVSRKTNEAVYGEPLLMKIIPKPNFYKFHAFKCRPFPCLATVERLMGKYFSIILPNLSLLQNSLTLKLYTFWKTGAFLALSAADISCTSTLMTRLNLKPCSFKDSLLWDSVCNQVWGIV